MTIEEKFYVTIDVLIFKLERRLRVLFLKKTKRKRLAMTRNLCNQNKTLEPKMGKSLKLHIDMIQRELTVNEVCNSFPQKVATHLLYQNLILWLRQH